MTDAGIPHDSSSLLERLPTPPEELSIFRLGRLLLLLDEAQQGKRPALDIERLGFYDFFAANPFLVVPDDERARTRLFLSGFDSRTLGYQSSFHRFATRRQRMRFDLSQLVGYGLVAAEVQDGKVAFALTDHGRDVATSFTSLYAQAYRESSQFIITTLNKLSDQRLHRQAGDWLQSNAFLIDLFDAEPGG